MNTTKEISRVNGFNTTQLGGLVELLKDHPEGGRVSFYASTKWNDGGNVTTHLNGYSIDGQMHHQQQRQFIVRGDEPSEFGASDAAPAPPEMLMHATANCILATANAYAALQGIRLTHLEAKLESDMDLHGMFGLDDNIRPGLNELRATISVDGDADEDTLKQIVNLGVQYSPIRDSVQDGIKISSNVEIYRAATVTPVQANNNK